MKIRLHIDREKDGHVIVEAPPQMRSLMTHSASMYVPLPYVAFAVRYRKRKTGFSYQGYNDSGLNVFGSLNPLASLKNQVFGLPTDPRFSVCTNHDYDGARFEKLKDLVNTVVGLWYGSIHTVQYQPFSNGWKNHKLEDISNGEWLRSVRLENLLANLSISNTEKIDFLDEKWPVNLNTSPLQDEEDIGWQCDCAMCVRGRREQ